MMRMWKPTALAVALTLAGPARAQISTSATPIYHGELDIRPAVGTIDGSTGIGTLHVRGWRLVLAETSNGIFPDREPVVVALGEESFMLPAGSLTRSRSGRVFRYHAAAGAGPRGFTSFRIARRANGSYRVTFTLIGIDMSPLVLATPVCQPMAVIVGDDDGFRGALLSRPNFKRRVFIPRGCDASNDWPWIQS
jgi:hypothetical protein